MSGEAPGPRPAPGLPGLGGTLSDVDEEEEEEAWLRGAPSPGAPSSSVLSRSSLSEAEEEGELVEDPEEADAEDEEEAEDDSFPSSSPPLSSSRGRAGRRRTPTPLGSRLASSQGGSAVSRSRSRSDSVGREAVRAGRGGHEGGDPGPGGR